MTNFFKLLGIFTFIAILAFGGDWVYKNFPEVIDYTLKAIGILTIVIIPIYLFLRFKYGKNWAFKVGLNFYFGEGLVSAIKTLIDDFKKGKVQTEKVAEVAAHVLWRVTRIGFFAVVIAIVPLLILLNQNTLLKRQNDKIDIQNSLMEADRRGALIVLMSNVLDQMNEEINIQRQDTLRKNSDADLDSIYYDLSEPLIGRIAALSQGFKPYQLLYGDSLDDKRLSPERAQLLLALLYSKLSDKTFKKIKAISTFAYADLNRTKLDGLDLSGTQLEGANLEFSSLINAKLKDSNLNYASFNNSVLEKVDFSSTKTTYIDSITNKRQRELMRLLAWNVESNSSLHGVSFCNARLNDINFTACNLQNVDFRNVEGLNINFKNANLSGSSLVNSTFNFSRFENTNLQNTDLSFSQLNGSSFKNAHFTNVRLDNTVLINVNFEGASGLSVGQLLKAKTLNGAINLPTKIKQELLEKKPCLFEMQFGASGCNE